VHRLPAIPSRHAVTGVIALVACHGSGKSTLTADLYAHLRDAQPTELLYLGQSSGNIAQWIRGVPVIGPAFGRYLVRRAERAHTKDDKAAAPDLATALVIHLLSRWRYHKFRRVLVLSRRGVRVITDRYPQAEVPGFYFDGPGLVAAGSTSRCVRWLAARELRLYQRMASHVPALLIRLNIDAETAHARKPDHKRAMLHDKVTVIPTLHFNGARILDLDGRDPYPQVLQAALDAALAAA